MLHFISDSQATFHLDNEEKVLSTLNRLGVGFEIKKPSYYLQQIGCLKAKVVFDYSLSVRELFILQNDKIFS
jgi:hypothetical protein